MADGIASLRANKRNRATRQAPPPRHPMPATAVAEFASAADAEVAQAQGTTAAAPDSGTPAAAPAPTVHETPAVTEPVQGPPAKPAARAAGRQAAPAVRPEAHALPDLSIDWADPLMHVANQTRISVANSVATRFKTVADQPGQPPQTELIMEAVNDQLQRLPELVLGRRPEAVQPESGFFIRRSSVQSADPWVPVYMRPMAGELEALSRIVDWVSLVITDGHPGRKKATRSEVITAALNASYPNDAKR